MLPSSEPVLEMLAKLQLSAVGVRLPELASCPSPSVPLPPALWKSPKSPKPSNDVPSVSSSERDDGKVNGSASPAAAASENGPNVSYRA